MSFLSAEQQLQIKLGLQQLIDSCDNLELHQVIWAEIIYSFPNQYIPPIRVPNNFSIYDFDKNTMEQYLIAIKKFLVI
jgi:hypothetical protein